MTNLINSVYSPFCQAVAQTYTTKYVHNVISQALLIGTERESKIGEGCNRGIRRWNSRWKMYFSNFLTSIWLNKSSIPSTLKAQKCFDFGKSLLNSSPPCLLKPAKVAVRSLASHLIEMYANETKFLSGHQSFVF